jgi:hypothetical protein
MSSLMDTGQPQMPVSAIPMLVPIQEEVDEDEVLEVDEDEVPEVDEDKLRDEDEDNDIALLMQTIPDFKIPDNILLLIYTLGRYNPVHKGHMASIMTAIKLAKKNKGKALILLGNGAAGAKRDNPLSFDLKQRIIMKHIDRRYNDSYELIEKTSPVSDVKSFISKSAMMDKDKRTPYIVHLTAKKEAKPDEKPDEEKLKFINEYLKKAGYTTYSLAITPTKIEGKDMSATSVRKFANEKDFKEFAVKYGKFYGEMTKEVYYAIRSANLEDIKPVSKHKGYTPYSGNRTSAKFKTPTHNDGTRKGGKRKSGTHKNKNKRKGITKKRKPYKSISK